MKNKDIQNSKKKGSKRVKAILNKIVPFEEWIKTPRTESQIEAYHKLKQELEKMQ
jgi:hypothetical protein